MGEFIWNSRKALRVLLESQAVFRLHRQSKKEIRLKEETVRAKLLDISLGGCGIESPNFLPVGVKVNVFLNRSLLAGGAVTRTHSKIVGVVRTSKQLPNRKYRLGIQFEKVSSEDQKLIRDLVEKQERREDPRISFGS